MPVISGLQLGARVSGKAETISAIQSYVTDIKNAGAKLVVLPEALLGGYPKGADFGARVGFAPIKAARTFGNIGKTPLTCRGMNVTRWRLCRLKQGRLLSSALLSARARLYFVRRSSLTPLRG